VESHEEEEWRYWRLLLFLCAFLFLTLSSLNNRIMVKGRAIRKCLTRSDYESKHQDCGVSWEHQFISSFVIVCTRNNDAAEIRWWTFYPFITCISLYFKNERILTSLGSLGLWWLLLLYFVRGGYLDICLFNNIWSFKFWPKIKIPFCSFHQSCMAGGRNVLSRTK